MGWAGGGTSKRERVDVYRQLTHVVVPQKLTRLYSSYTPINIKSDIRNMEAIMPLKHFLNKFGLFHFKSNRLVKSSIFLLFCCCLGDTEKESFIALSGKRRHIGLVPQKLHLL